MATKRQPPPSLRKLILLFVSASVICSGYFTALSAASGQLDEASTMHPETDVPNEERAPGFVDTTIQAMKDVAALRHDSNKEAYLDDMLRNIVDLSVTNRYHSQEFKEVADRVIRAHFTTSGAMTFLFEGLVRANQAKQTAEPLHKVSLLGELCSEILYVESLPKPSSPAYKVIHKLKPGERILLRLKAPLLQHWKARGLTLNDFSELLKVDVTTDAFFDDHVVLPRIDLFAKHTSRELGNPFDLLLNSFQNSFSDHDIAAKVLAAGAETKPGSVAERLMQALLRHWDVIKVSPEVLLPQLLPSFEENDILNGPLKLWVTHSEPYLKENLYPTLLRKLLHPDDDLTEPLFVLLRNEERELALVDLIEAEWKKVFEPRRSETDDDRASPLAWPIFRVLCTHWKDHEVSLSTIKEFLQLSNLKHDRRRACIMYSLISDPHFLFPALEPVVTDVEMAEVVSLVVDWDERVYWELSNGLTRYWKTQKLSAIDLFSLLKLQLPDKGLFQNPLLTVWYDYTLTAHSKRAEAVRWMSNWLKERYDDKTFETLLYDAVRASDGKLQQISFKLLAIRWIDKGMQFSDISLLGLESSKMRVWFEGLRKVKKVRFSLEKKPSWWKAILE